ncbi:MAG: CRISPR-associated endonuclease Cas3'', partial [Myxococcales bacterium]|nr:CRISPR-associated endonuclease Cas3'' [Myxococcales bacterium]
MRRFYARSLEGADSEAWQRLEDHLRGVARRAREAAAAFESGDWGYVAGLWHDIGKYRPEFQRKLRGEPFQGSSEHSGAGAALAAAADPKLGLPLAFVIAGHHAGLANWIDSEGGVTPLKERLASNRAVLDAIRRDVPAEIRDASLPTALPSLLDPRTLSDMDARRLASEFWTRMLFSALVDADRLDAEAFVTPNRAKFRAGFSSVSTLRERLDAYLEAKIDGLTETARSTRVNRARAEVLAACREAADREPGFFSLTVPTGGGKTLSAMSFALRHAERRGLRRVIVVIPYTSIIEQNAREYRRAIGDEEVIEHHSNFDVEKYRQARGETWATRRDLATENWEAPVIVTTTVQFFESLFSNRPGRCRKLHNVAKSVIVLDEVQTLPTDFLVPILDGLNELVARYGCSVVLSTATPPALVARPAFEFGLGDVRPIVDDSGALARDLKRVEYEWPDPDEAPIPWDVLADEVAAHDRALVVVHRRGDARHLAVLLDARRGDEAIVHLSALMCPAHRSAVVDAVKARLARGERCLLVSTQLIEAGVDVDFPIVYRAFGGLDSIVQAAGRCNREGRLERGRVVVFRAPSEPPFGMPRKGLAETASLLREFEGALDAEDPAVSERYFRALYHASTLDSHHIQTKRRELKFANVSAKFKMIEDGATETVVVPWGDGAARI